MHSPTHYALRGSALELHSNSNRLPSSATAQHPIAKIASGKEKTASINMETINASKYEHPLGILVHLCVYPKPKCSRPAASWRGESRHPADVAEN
jgi:hypothetical protein